MKLPTVFFKGEGLSNRFVSSFWIGETAEKCLCYVSIYIHQPYPAGKGIPAYIRNSKPETLFLKGYSMLHVYITTTTNLLLMLVRGDVVWHLIFVAVVINKYFIRWFPACVPMFKEVFI